MIINKNNKSNDRSKIYRNTFVVLCILQSAGLIVFILSMLFLAQLSRSGASGTEFFALGLFITLVPAVVAVAFVNMLGLPFYLVKYKPRGKELISGILSLLISVIIVTFGAYNFYQIKYAIPNKINNQYEQSINKVQENEQESAEKYNATTKSKDDALSLLQNCRVDYFIGQTEGEDGISSATDKNTKSWLEKAEKSKTGIEILENSPSTYIFASSSATLELQDTVREFRDTCYENKKIYIIIGDWVESEYPLGTWTRVKL